MGEQHVAQHESWTTGYFDATLLPGELRVGHIPADRVASCIFALVKLLVVDAEDSEKSPFKRQERGPGSASSSASSSGGGLNGGVLNLGSGSLPVLDELELDDVVVDGVGVGVGVGVASDVRVGTGAGTPGVKVMIVQDLGGVTVIVNESSFRRLHTAGVASSMRWAPTPWRALQIHLGPASEDAPGIISYLSSMLSERNVSILNFSTFEADLILVQDFDLLKARNFLAECGHNGVEGIKEQIAERRKSQGQGEGQGEGQGQGQGHGQGQEEQHEQQEHQQQHKAKGGRTNRGSSTSSETILTASLAVLQTTMFLASIKRHVLKQSMFALMKQLMRNVDVHLSVVAQQQRGDHTKGAETNGGATSAGPGSSSNGSSRDYIWAYFSTHEEVSILVDESDLLDFPDDSLVICPQRWKAVRLVGKDIPFNETGVVHLMSSPCEVGAQILNMSTFTTNVTLVAEADTQIALKRLEQELRSLT